MVITLPRFKLISINRGEKIHHIVTEMVSIHDANDLCMFTSMMCLSCAFVQVLHVITFTVKTSPHLHVCHCRVMRSLQKAGRFVYTYSRAVVV